jgi:hypothetical protein
VWDDLNFLLSTAEKSARAVFARETGMEWESCLGYLRPGERSRWRSELQGFRIVKRPPSRAAMLAHNALGCISMVRERPPKSLLEAHFALSYFRAGRDLARAGLLPDALRGHKMLAHLLTAQSSRSEQCARNKVLCLQKAFEFHGENPDASKTQLAIKVSDNLQKDGIQIAWPTVRRHLRGVKFPASEQKA